MWFWIHFFWTDSVLRCFKNITYNKLMDTSAQHVPKDDISYRPSNPPRPRVMFQSCNLASVAKSEHGTPRPHSLNAKPIPLESWCCSFATQHHPAMSLYDTCFTIHRWSMKTHQKTTCLTPPSISTNSQAPLAMADDVKIYKHFTNQ